MLRVFSLNTKERAGIVLAVAGDVRGQEVLTSDRSTV